MAELADILDELDGLQVETQPQRVRRRSRDFYWYSPILKRQLDHVSGDAVATVRDEAELIRVVRWAYAHDVPGSGWQGSQTVPRVVSLVSGADGVELRQHPVQEVATLRSRELARLDSVRITPDADPVGDASVTGDALDLFAKIRPGETHRVGLAVRESAGQRTRVELDVPNEELIVDRGESGALFSPETFAVETGPLPLLEDGTVELRLLVDRSSLEVFANDGRYTNTNLIFPDSGSTGVSSFAHGGTAELLEFVAFELAP